MSELIDNQTRNRNLIANTQIKFTIISFCLIHSIATQQQQSLKMMLNSKSIAIIGLSLASLAVVISGEFTDCGSESGEVLSISVTNCSATADECDLKTGTNVSVDTRFLSKTNSSSATVKLWGVISGVPVPFPISPSDACGHWNIECPLINGNNYELILTLPILSKYPKISLQIRLALIDSNGKKIICQQFPAQIEAQ